jgi:hypothetical protein
MRQLHRIGNPRQDKRPRSVQNRLRSEGPPAPRIAHPQYRLTLAQLHPRLRRFRYRRPKLNHLAPLGQGDPLHLLVKSRRNIELDHSCHGGPPIFFLANTRKRGNSDAKGLVPRLIRHSAEVFSPHEHDVEAILREAMKALCQWIDSRHGCAKHSCRNHQKSSSESQGEVPGKNL